MNKSKRFFKSIKPQAATLAPKVFKFPSISLTIPEKMLGLSFLSPVFIIAFIVSFLIMAIGIVGNDLRNNFTKLSEVNKERAVTQAQIIEWKGALNSYKNYKDGYYMLSVLEYKLGNYQESFEYIKKALVIDPNYKEAKILLERLKDGA